MSDNKCCPSHCCSRHGCKYGHEDCPVELGIEPGIICESCDYEHLERLEAIKQCTLKIMNKRIKALKTLLEKPCES